MKRVLVAYATVYGSTREVAEAVGAALGERGIEVDVRAARDVGALDGYSGVVLGGALYFFRWHRDARRFLARHRPSLAGLPVAVFGMGPFNDTPDELDSARKPLDAFLAKKAWLSPVSVRVFGGRHDPDRLRFPHNMPAIRNIPASDARDWEAIRAWGQELAGMLQAG